MAAHRNHYVWKESVKKENVIRQLWEKKYFRELKNNDPGRKQFFGPSKKPLKFASPNMQKKMLCGEKVPKMEVNYNSKPGPRRFDKKQHGDTGNLYRSLDTKQWGDYGDGQQAYMTAAPPVYQPSVPKPMPSGDYSGDYFKPANQKQTIRRQAENARDRYPVDKSRTRRESIPRKANFRNLQYPTQDQFNPSNPRYNTNKQRTTNEYDRIYNGDKQQENMQEYNHRKHWYDQQSMKGRVEHQNSRDAKQHTDYKDKSSSKVNSDYYKRQNCSKQRHEDPGRYERYRAKWEDPKQIAYYFICCHCGKEPYECQTVRNYCYPSVYGQHGAPSYDQRGTQPYGHTARPPYTHPAPPMYAQAVTPPYYR